MRHHLFTVACAFTLLLSDVGIAPTSAWASPQVAKVASVADDLLKWISKLRKLDGEAAMAADEVTEILKGIQKSGGDISSEVAELMRRNWSQLGRGVLDSDLLLLLSKRPDICEPAFDLAIRLQLRSLAPRLAKLSEELGEKAPNLMKALATKFDKEQAILYMKGISGRMLSQKQVGRVAEALEQSALSTQEMGGAFECLTRAQLSRGTNKSLSGLREGGEVVSSQYNKVHGIDGVGATPDGRPVIFEISMYKNKALGETVDGVQLSPAWTADRWNKAMDVPELIAEFRRIGVNESHLRKVTTVDTVTWPRKLVVAHDSALTDANRMAAEIGPKDLFVLGGN